MVQRGRFAGNNWVDISGLNEFVTEMASYSDLQIEAECDRWEGHINHMKQVCVCIFVEK